MTELEKIEYAKSFIDKLANGINPLDGTVLPEDDIANNVRMSRCFFFVSDVLRQVIENGGITPAASERVRKTEFHLTEEEKSTLQVSSLPVYVSDISKYLNTVIDVSRTKKISAIAINNWLSAIGALEDSQMPNGKSKRVPTELGLSLGIIAEERTGQYGQYTAILFSPHAQQYIYDNLEAIINAKAEKRNSSIAHQGQAWTPELDKNLTEMYYIGVYVREIASSLVRTQGGIAARLKKLGLIDERSDAYTSDTPTNN